MNKRLIASRERVKKLRKFKAQKQRQARLRVLLNRIGGEARREVLREGRRQIRVHARRQLRRFLPLV